MVMLFTDPRMLDHVPGRGHPDRPERLEAVLRHLKRTGLMFTCPSGKVRPATDEELRRVHSAAYLDRVRSYADRGGGHIEADTWLSSGSDLAARLAAGAAIEAVSAVVGGETARAFCAVRPPGHHARPSDAMGFCLYGNVAVAAMDAVTRLGVNRVLVVDFDVHHGNGTQEVFYADPRVAFFSIHRYPFYPGSGAADETGTGPGLGFTRNVPVHYGTSQQDYRGLFRRALERIADHARPDLILISAGFDAHAEDPVGDLGLEVEDFERLTRDVVEIAEVHTGGRIVSVMEGGYNTSILAGCVEAHLLALGAELDPTH